ncbi:unnamed protein product [Cyprideis torosa]|uniref:NAD-dependent epimerase/dehydratase domain-containing protein n=1 Tax=Cyprideis torosa TaxID=163714 RepID=A0A7R8W2Y1_9CRUS|nr:unnamed protein product [Cyprideis torosa]CAG0882440.1 unnamed protein product [Cyprideis torosa]
MEVIRPSVEGTLNVLRSCVEVGGVKRVVLTSSIAAISECVNLREDEVLDESNWTDTECPYIDGYYKSKVIRPSVEGTLNVLRSCVEVGGVKRVVLTSSIAAISECVNMREDEVLDESNWTDTECPNIDGYYKSKVFSELAAWNFMQELDEDKKFELCVINPAFTIGPMLSRGNKDATSVVMIRQYLEREFPAVPNFRIPIIDVRDVALAHLRAMFTAEAADRRFICAGPSISMTQIGKMNGQPVCRFQRKGKDGYVGSPSVASGFQPSTREN